MQKSLSELAFEKEIIKSLDDNGWHYRPDLSHSTEEKLLSNWREVLNRQNVERLKDTPSPMKNLIKLNRKFLR
ncbi:Uncharacterised protein [Haemophilus parahaemolyticus]|uniref:Uncharacterized protein n=1 Tax=Haemophilus parahaemolyticus TaxID=735 RepID=A0A377ICJ3_HAEPH|nr:hypothetical protein [Haemophilus parahaemolyticus]STO73037.1 Uncharacterised protein [Haemophilus parahaemolyticus]